jgi:DNA-binding NarL/FixJ family response regulator
MTSADGVAPLAAVIRLVIADDQMLVRAGLRLILEGEPDLVVVAEASDGEQAVLAVGAHRPDVVLMDVRMPGTDGLAATRRLRDSPPAGMGSSPPVLILTTFEDDDVLWGAVEAGAAGFVLKDTPADDLVAAIRTTAHGGSWLDPRVTPRLLHRLRDQRRPDPAVLGQLTGREVEVLASMARGATNQEIAAELFLSERTVKSHVGSIFTKLGARDRSAAILLAFRAGLVDPRSC